MPWLIARSVATIDRTIVRRMSGFIVRSVATIDRTIGRTINRQHSLKSRFPHNTPCHFVPQATLQELMVESDERNCNSQPADVAVNVQFELDDFLNVTDTSRVLESTNLTNDAMRVRIGTSFFSSYWSPFTMGSMYEDIRLHVVWPYISSLALPSPRYHPSHCPTIFSYAFPLVILSCTFIPIVILPIPCFSLHHTNSTSFPGPSLRFPPLSLSP